MRWTISNEATYSLNKYKKYYPGQWPLERDNFLVALLKVQSISSVYYNLCRGGNGDLRLGIRRAARPRNGLPDSVIGNQNTYHDVLSSVATAISTNSPFHVFFNPRYDIYHFLRSRMITRNRFIGRETISMFQ